MRINRIYSMLLLCILSSCIAPPKITAHFNPSDAAFIHQKGTGSLRGQAFLRRNDGIVIYAAGSTVFLIPKTAYSSERMNAMYRGGKLNSSVPPPPSPPGYEEATRSTRADGEGRFEFAAVADGDYYAATQVMWLVGNAPQGGALMETVSIRSGIPAEIIMTGQ